MAVFLPVDVKKLASDTQIGKPLRNFITEQESYNVNDFQEAINELEKLRENIRQGSEKKENTITNYERYYALLSSIEKRIPVNEHEVKINFSWYDIYKQKKIGRYSIVYEKACLLFNIAAIYSQTAVLENLENTNGIKLACKNFKYSAGTFEQVKEYLASYPEEAASPDLVADSLTMLSNLMLAQAQELFYMMAVKEETTNPVVISKLAAQASDFYHVTFDTMSSNTLKTLLPKRWLPYAEFKRDYMKAVAHFQLGRERKEAKAYGEELGRYRVASKLIDSTLRFKPQLPEFVHVVEEIMTKIKHYEKGAQRDNDMIYHESVPPEHKLPPLGRKAMVKPERLPEDKLFCSSTTDPFSTLIPFKARKADSVYSERKAQLLRDITKQVEDHNNMAKNALHSMSLPGALEALETPHGIPVSLLKKMEFVKKENGLDGLQEKIEDLRKMANDNSGILDSAINLLDEEEKEDNNMKTTHGDRWSRTPSHALTSNLRVEGQKHKANLEHAIKSDGYILNMINENRKGIELLRADQGQILQLLPETVRQDVSVGTLKQLLKQLDQLIYTRETALNQLRELIAKDDIMEKLLRASEADQEKVFAHELTKYNEILNTIKNSLNQTELLNSIKAENDTFLQKRNSNEQLVQRQAVLQEFELSYNTYNLLRDHICEGLQFYSSFKDILNKFKVKCSDFVYARKTEKMDHIQEIQTRPTPPGGFIVTTKAAANPTAPPPYPTSVVVPTSSTIQSPPQPQQPLQQSQQQPQQQIQIQKTQPAPPPAYYQPVLSQSINASQNQPMPVPMVIPGAQNPIYYPATQSPYGTGMVQMVPVMMPRPNISQMGVPQYYAIPQQQGPKPSAFPPNPYNM